MPTFYFDPTASGSTGVGTQANPYTNQSQLAGIPIGPNNLLLFKRGTTWRPGLASNSGNFSNYLLPWQFFTASGCHIGDYGD
jgi:hypothetical protein